MPPYTASRPEHPRSSKDQDTEQTMSSSYFDQGHDLSQNTTSLPHRASMRSSAASSETMRATPPINIPNSNDTAVASNGSPSNRTRNSYMDHFMQNRRPSITFDNEVRTDMGPRQSLNEPLPRRSGREDRRGRSILHELAEERVHHHRAHSESERDEFDSNTGRHLPKFSTSPPRDGPHIGEPRFPLLQRTIDEMARESQLTLDTQPTSLTSASTMSPRSEAIHTPRDEEADYPLSPLPISPNPRQTSTSLESSAPRPFRRTASQRWRDGEVTQDFFSRAGNSLRRSTREGTSYRSSRRGTGSAASSYLRAFSLNSGDGENCGPPAVDAEGQTIGEDYVLGKQIGYGGFSIIREVTQISAETGMQRKLAVKIVKRQIEGKTEAENDAAQAEFDHEVELWRFLNHPNVLPLEAVYKLDEATFCFIPLNTGGTLFDLVRANRQGVPIDIAKSYAYQLACALRYLHLDARVAHRDVKLENCLIETTNGEPGVLRLCDFGMADWLDNDHDAQSPGSVSSSSDRPGSRAMGPADTSSSAFAGGSLEYAPPEIVRIASTRSLPGQAQNNLSPPTLYRNHISAAVDMWAFGVCLFTLIAGKRPFSNSFTPRVVMAILAGEWDRELVATKADGDEDLIDLIGGCLIMKEKSRWDIRAVMECQWFEEERNKADDLNDTRNGGWRL